MSIKSKAELRIQNDALITTNANREITGSILNGHIEDVIDSYANIGSIGGGDVTVGTNGDYATIELAVADGHYILKIISDITVSTNITVAYLHLCGLVNSDASRNEIELGTTRLLVSSLKVENLIMNSSVTGVNIYLMSGSHIELNNVKISLQAIGNAYLNSVSSILNGRDIELVMNSRSDRFSFFTNVSGKLTLSGGTMANNGNGSSVLKGFIEHLHRTGSWVGGTSSGSAQIRIDSLATIAFTDYTGSGGALSFFGGKILGGTANALVIRLVGAGTNAGYLKNVAVDGNVYVYNPSATFSMEDSSLGGLQYGNLSYLAYFTFRNTTFNGGVTFGTSTTLYSQNDTFGGAVTIQGDNNTLINSTIDSETITVAATADKTTIISPRTLTSIVDSGSDTQIISPNLI